MFIFKLITLLFLMCSACFVHASEKNFSFRHGEKVSLRTLEMSITGTDWVVSCIDSNLFLVTEELSVYVVDFENDLAFELTEESNRPLPYGLVEFELVRWKQNLMILGGMLNPLDVIYAEQSGLIPKSSGYDIMMNLRVFPSLLFDTESNDWENTDWKTKPIGRHKFGFSEAGSALTRRLIVFGGRANQNSYLDDTLIYDGNQWEQVHTTESQSPSGRIFPSICRYPGSNDTVVLFGGFGPDRKSEKNILHEDTWYFDLKNRKWRKVSINNNVISPRMKFNMANCGEFVLGYGGIGEESREESWHYDTYMLIPDKGWERVALNEYPKISDVRFFGKVKEEITLIGPSDDSNSIEVWVFKERKWMKKR